MIIGSIIGLILLIGGITLYRTFALYEEKKEFNVLKGKVPQFSSGDVTIAALINGEPSSVIPGKEDGYIFESVTCNNEAEAEWNNDTWKITIGNLTTSKTTCTLSFKNGLAKALTNCNKDGATCLLENSSLDSINLAYDETVDNNLRYIGSNPNNYVLFNGELWRIIGVMNNIKDSDGNVGSHLKIIREESIGNYSWDNKGANGSNDWTDAALMHVLNNRVYYNRTSGVCPDLNNEGTTPCDFSGIGLTNEAKEMISNVVWNLGGRPDWNVPANVFYANERGNLVYNGHATEWIGKVGLMYLSDYGYAVGEDVRNTCLVSNLRDYASNSCYSHDWLSGGNPYSWVLTPSSSDNTVYVFHYNGVISNAYVYFGSAIVRPTLFLDSNVKIVGDGDGSSEHPYMLKLG